MKITVNLLERYSPKDEYILFLKNNYPLGVELSELIQNPKITTDFLHFLRKYVILTSDDLKLYFNACKVDENSHNIWTSTNVDHSQCVWNSTNVQDSGYIFDSEKIKNSQFVYNCVDISNSSNLLLSRQVRRSEKIMNSQIITNCEQVNFSEDIEWSKNIIYSNSIKDSSFIYTGKSLMNCHFCGFLTNCTCCLFCNNIQDSVYQIFNTAVEPEIFEKTIEEMSFLLRDETIRFIEVNYDSPYSINRFSSKNRLDDIFNGLSSKFYGWISTLPNYSDELFLNLFFREK